MATILCRTKGNANPKGKPRVYFTCHPEDFDRYFDKICEDIFKTHDCAIFYTEDMTAVIEEQDKATDLESNNLFIVPVTFRLLTKPNRAMDADIPFAWEKHIPILPFMVEPGIDEFYSRPDKFGELQYLNPYSTDLTEVPYEEKLKKYLESVLISDEMAKRVRAAFDAYIFLSYRKKDRRYANELMRLIHSHPECRDIAIWYDEFLTPGESFRENIERILSSSKLFALLVTPNLLEEPNGKANFVMGQEYPAAKESGIDILPAEMEETDKDTLSEKFEGIPNCMDPHGESFKARLLESISKIATTANDDDPTHSFLIGLAYIEGIDVEIDRQRGLSMITQAAEMDLPEAMEKLFWMYSEGITVALNYQNAIKWAKRLVEHYQQIHGIEHETTLVWMNDLALTYSNIGDYKNALDLQKQAYALCCKIKGIKHPLTLLALGNLALAYRRNGEFQQALDLYKQSYVLRNDVWGEEHPDTILSLQHLATAYGDSGDVAAELELGKKAYVHSCKHLGEGHPTTILILGNLAATYCDLGQFNTAFELGTKAYALSCEILGEEHLNTITYLNNLALIYDELGYPQKALEINERVYKIRCRLLGKEHPDTLTSLNDIAVTFGNLGDFPKALEMHEKVYALRCNMFGEKHHDTVISFNNLALTCYNLGDAYKAAPLLKKAHDLSREVFGSKHQFTQKTLDLFMLLYRTYSLCSHCGNRFKGFFHKKCSNCGKTKDY